MLFARPWMFLAKLVQLFPLFLVQVWSIFRLLHADDCQKCKNWKSMKTKLPPQRWLRCCLYSGPLLVCTATLWPLLQRNSELPVCQWRVSRAGVMSGPAAAENVVEWSECHSCPSEWQRYHGNLESDSPPAFYLCLEALNCPLFAKNPDLAGSLFRWASDNSHPASLKFSAKLSANIFFIRREGGKASAEEVNH